MSTDYFVELFEYDSTVNRELLDALRASAHLSERAMAIFAHLLSAKKVSLVPMLQRRHVRSDGPPSNGVCNVNRCAQYAIPLTQDAATTVHELTGTMA